MVSVPSWSVDQSSAPLGLFALSGIQVAVLTIPAVASIFKVAPLPIEDWALMGVGPSAIPPDGTDKGATTTMKVLGAIDRVAELAPLHNPGCLAGTRAARLCIWFDLPMVAALDTDFHCSISPRAGEKRLFAS
jgi:hypothetical protein